jgi:hypothetical protein
MDLSNLRRDMPPQPHLQGQKSHESPKGIPRHQRHRHPVLRVPDASGTQVDFQTQHAFTSIDLQTDAMYGPSSSAPLSSLHQTVESTARFPPGVSSGGSSAPVLPNDQPYSTTNLANADNQVENGNGYATRSRTPASTSRQEETSVTHIENLEYAPTTNSTGCMQEVLFAPGATGGHLPDYSRVQRRLLLPPENKPPSDIDSEGTSIMNSESAGADTFDGLIHRSGFLPQPVRLSQILMLDVMPLTESTLESTSNAPAASTSPTSPENGKSSYFGLATAFVANILDWKDHIVKLSPAEEQEMEDEKELAQRQVDALNSFTDGFIGDNLGDLMENDQFTTAPNLRPSRSFQASRPSSGALINQYLALSSALNNFSPRQPQPQSTSPDVTQSEIELNRARTLEHLTRRREPNDNLPGSLFSASVGDIINDPQQALERLLGGSQAQLHAQQEFNTDHLELALTPFQPQACQVLEDQIEYRSLDQLLESCLEFIIYQLGSVEQIPRYFTYPLGVGYVRQRLQEHFGDEVMGYALGVFHRIMERRNPSVSIDEDDIWASWRYDYAHRNVSTPAVPSLSRLRRAGS